LACPDGLLRVVDQVTLLVNLLGKLPHGMEIGEYHISVQTVQ